MKFLFIIIIGFLASGTLYAGVGTDYNSMMEYRKGPFGLNQLQGTKSRVIVNRGVPAGDFLFQAAYRNEQAKSMISKYDLYFANLFTTNYYELIGEFVYNSANESYPLDHASLLSSADKAASKAQSMILSWVLEKHYVEHFPGTALQKSFQLRGISDTENEREFAHYFFNFYLSAIEAQIYYLPAVLLIQDSPISSSASINKARDLVSKSYDHFEKRWGNRDPRVERLYKLRNAIHNQLSEAIIADIDRYVKDFPYYKAEGHTYLFKVQDILREYYSVDLNKLAKMASDTSGLSGITDNIDSDSAASLLEFSKRVALLRDDLVLDSTSDKTRTLLFITSATQFISKELLRVSALNKLSLEAFVYLAYADGFLLERNKDFFLNKAATANTPAALNQVRGQIISTSVASLNRLFSEKLSLWAQIEPLMDGFMDTVIKSSSLSALNQIN